MAFLFTIEQIELVRRLRRTGMSKEQVWRAYEEMDRLDAELNGLSSAEPSPDTGSPKPVTNGSKPSKALPNSSQTLPPIEFNSNSVNEICAKTVASYSRNGCQSFPSSSHHNSYPSTSLDKSSHSLPAIGQSFGLSSQLDISDSEDMSPKEPSVTITPIPSLPSTDNALAISQRTFFGAEEPSELVEFKKKGEPVMLNEIRGFVNKYNIRQIMIAEMTKISQGYVSRFFRGEGHDMSDKSKNLIYMWYLSCRSRPELLTQFCPQTIGERRTQLSEAGDLLPIRRDRFIFRKEHLMILDKYFKDNPYPDASTKEVIADECNAYIERSTGRALKERDKVTISVVSNWFNNKRKEVKTRRGPSGQTLLTLNDQLALEGMASNHLEANHSLYSNHSQDCTVEQLETRPDLSMLADFSRQDSIELSDDMSADSQQTYANQSNDDQNNEDHYLDNRSGEQLKNNFTIKLEPSY